MVRQRPDETKLQGLSWALLQPSERAAVSRILEGLSDRRRRLARLARGSSERAGLETDLASIRGELLEAIDFACFEAKQVSTVDVDARQLAGEQRKLPAGNETKKTMKTIDVVGTTVRRIEGG